MNATQYKILIVDDEPGILTMLKDYFDFHGYLVYTTTNGKEALDAVSNEPDIILLDINMPVMDGLDVCRTIREHITCPILLLTARTEETDSIIGFQTGADDYIKKPFHINELGARVEAHLRRGERDSAKGANARVIGQLAINYVKRQVIYKDTTIHFTKTEFDIIELLSQNPGQVFDRERMYEIVRGFDGEGDNSVLTEHIRRIRQKLKLETGQSYIETVWGVGYTWNS